MQSPAASRGAVWGFSVRPTRNEFFKPSTVIGRESYRSKTSIEAVFQPRPLSYKRSRQVDETFFVLVSNKWFKDTDEFRRRCSFVTSKAVTGSTDLVGMLEQFHYLHTELNGTTWDSFLVFPYWLPRKLVRPSSGGFTLGLRQISFGSHPFPFSRALRGAKESFCTYT